MTTYETISVTAAIVALLISAIALFFNGVKTRESTKALVLDQQLARGNAVMHFTSRFFDLLKEGEPVSKFSDTDWAYQFWSLHSTEFYFFQHGMLPAFMYTLWMIDLAKLYCKEAHGAKIRKSHTDHLETYSFNYPDMIEFFNEIYERAKSCDNENMRNRRIAEYVTPWIAEHRKSIVA